MMSCQARGQVTWQWHGPCHASSECSECSAIRPTTQLLGFRLLEGRRFDFCEKTWKSALFVAMPFVTGSVLVPFVARPGAPIVASDRS